MSLSSCADFILNLVSGVKSFIFFAQNSIVQELCSFVLLDTWYFLSGRFKASSKSYTKYSLPFLIKINLFVSSTAVLKFLVIPLVSDTTKFSPSGLLYVFNSFPAEFVTLTLPAAK